MDSNSKTNGTNSGSKDDIYEVQEIVGMKSDGDITVYRVRWKGYGPQSDTWEPESNLRTVWKMVEKYKTKINKMPLVSRRRGRPSTSGSSSGSGSGTGITADCSAGNSTGITSKNNSTVDQNSKRGEQLAMNCIKRQKISLNNINNNNIKRFNDKKIMKKNHKKRMRYSFTTEVTKDTFWKDLEEGRIDVFKEDLYSRVKSRASSRGNSTENSPKPVNSPSKEFDKCWQNSDSTDTDINKSVENENRPTIEFMDGDLRIKFCKTEALMSAIKDSDQELAKILIKNGSDINSTFGNKNGSTPLMVCCEDNNIDMTRFLLSSGALKDTQNQNGDTALMIACRLGFEEIIKLLLIYGSNFAQINKIGMNALRIAKISDKQFIKDVLVEHISKLTISLEVQVMNILCNTANIVNALFPIQCFSLSEGKQFRLWFEFDEDRYHRKPGVGYILFVANTSISDKQINCQFSGPNVVEEVLLNGTAQKPLTEGAQFVFSFQPLQRGSNELVLNSVEVEPENNQIKLLVCAYELKLINDSQCYDKHN